MNDPRRVWVPWYRQRVMLRYIIPATMFWAMAIRGARDIPSLPFAATLGTVFCATVAVLFTRISWQERFPLRSAKRYTDEVR
jgi:hypothetical protein